MKDYTQCWDLTPEEFEREVTAVCQELTELLVRKNKDYGNSALNPTSVFSSGDVLEKLAVRMDDKISRIRNFGGVKAIWANADDGGEDSVKDLIGYLIIAQVLRRLHQEKENN